MRIWSLLLLISFEAFAYQSTVNGGGKSLTWPNSQILLSIDSTNDDITSGTASTIIQQSVSEWNAQSPRQITTTNSSVNTVSFKNDFSIYGPGVIGVTELSYTSGGSIQAAKIYLNDGDFQFKSSPGLYSSGQVYLGDVVTHEMGHLLGLSHSEVLESTMFYAAFPGQSSLSTDDKAGIRSKYAPSSYGTISGKVKGGDDIGILGVHVLAFSRTTGEAASVISDSDGNFSIKGLDLNDTYYLYTTPLKNLSALPDQFSNVQTDFCPAKFVGGFFDACGRENEGFPQPINLSSSSKTVNVGDVTINCSLKVNEDYSHEKLQSTPGPVTIFDFTQDQRHEKAFVGAFLTANTFTWSKYDDLVIDLSGYSDASTSQKYLRLSFVARPFGNLLEYEMTVKRNGVQVGTGSITYSGITQTYDTDMDALLALSSTPATNVFEITIRARKLSTVLALQTFPELSAFVTSQNLPYLLMASLESGGAPILDNPALLSDNTACLDAPFSYAVSNARSLASGSEIASGKDEGTAPLSCGTTTGPGDGGGGPGMSLMVLGFALTLFLSYARKTAKNFLS